AASPMAAGFFIRRCPGEGARNSCREESAKIPGWQPNAGSPPKRTGGSSGADAREPVSGGFERVFGELVAGILEADGDVRAAVAQEADEPACVFLGNDRVGMAGGNEHRRGAKIG